MPDSTHRRKTAQLLTHTSGIDQTFGQLLSAPPDDDSIPFTAHQVLVSAPMQTPAGAYKLYNNLAFTAMQEIIEKVSGQTLYDYLAQNTFTPLGMADTSFSKLDEVPDLLKAGQCLLNNGTPQTLGIPVMRPAQEFVGTEVYVYPAEGLTFALGTHYLDIGSKFDLDRLRNVFAGCL